ncbi:MAG TPA: M20/M25/M40 family metallo-hydrolase [Clostridia bacterium]
MMWWLILPAFLLIFIAVLIGRAWFPAPPASGKAVGGASGPMPVFDRSGAVTRLGRLIASPTVSRRDPADMDQAVFDRFREELLPSLYPLVHSRLIRERIGDSGLLYRWAGRSAENPSVLMSHYDVVPVRETGWTHPPFGGEVHGGELWGRGALDTKLTLCAVFEATEHLLREGFVPDHDIYLSFAGDEEVIGQSAPAIVDVLSARGIRPSLVLDEGGAVLEGAFPGIPGQAALIGVAEKGMMDLELTVPGLGGHASTPPRSTAAGRLARAVVRVERRRFRPGLPQPVRELLTGLAPKAPFALRVVFSNLWCFGPLIARLSGHFSKELGAMTRTTLAFTMLEGSKQANVLPAKASAVANIRMLKGDTMDRVAAHVLRAAKDPSITHRILQSNEASPATSLGSPAWRKVRDTVSAVWPDALVLPYLMVACTDSRHFCRISDQVLRFSAMEITSAQMASIHNDDERVSTAAVEKCVEFYMRLVRTL